MITVMLVLIVGAVILTLAAALKKVEVWVPVLVLCIIEALHVLPLK